VIKPQKRTSDASRSFSVAAIDALAFDLLELDGVDYWPMPLRKRKEQLAPARPAQPRIVPSEHTDA